MTVIGCTGLLSPLCSGVTGIGSGVTGASASAVLGAVTGWVVQGASWLLGQIGGVLASTTSVDLGAGWFVGHYRAMAALAAVVILPLLLLSVLQAVYRQSAAVLVRVVAVQLPLALLLTAVAVQLVQLSLSATDALATSVSASAGVDVQKALQGVAVQLVSQAGGGPDSAPAFVVLLGALLVAVASFVLWLELLVRAAAVYVAVLFLPMALASLVWPAVSHWCRRLVDTLVALVLAKFVIVAILSLAAAALASGTGAGFSAVLGGAALLLLAAAAPFTLLRLVPMVEAGAIHQLEGARHRVRSAFVTAPRSAANYALGKAQASPLVAGEPGTGIEPDFGVPGDDGAHNGILPGGGASPLFMVAGDGRDGGGLGANDDWAGESPFPAAGQELPGLPGIPPWRGTPPTLSVRESIEPLSDRPATAGDPLGRGPKPVWDGPPARRPGSSDPGGRPTSMTIRVDEYGPVITGWDRLPAVGTDERPVDKLPTGDGGEAGGASPREP
ncbi:MAG TPA: hypothetical protein VMB82_02530 [Acidimicrobiales bacterium]|nr:hypothetical protein [Acidimicrobiales bacterium]